MDKDGVSVEGLIERLREGYDRNDLHTSAIEAADLILALSEREAAKDAEIARLREEVERLKSTCPFMLDDCQLTESDLCPVCGMDAERNGGPCVAERDALTKGQVDAG